VTFTRGKFDTEINIINQEEIMKSLLNHSTKLTTAILAVFVLFAFCSKVSAEPDEFYSAPAKKQSFMINNLKAGIKSDNEGLRRSSAYFAGKYQVAELTNALIDQLDKEPVIKNRKLILLSLYRIGEDKALKAIAKYVNTGKDTESRTLAQCMLNEYTISSTASFSQGNR